MSSGMRRPLRVGAVLLIYCLLTMGGAVRVLMVGVHTAMGDGTNSDGTSTNMIFPYKNESREDSFLIGAHAVIFGDETKVSQIVRKNESREDSPSFEKLGPYPFPKFTCPQCLMNRKEEQLLPGISIIGAMKAGTSSLALAFEQHPNVNSDNYLKECHFLEQNRKSDSRSRIMSTCKMRSRYHQWFLENNQHKHNDSEPRHEKLYYIDKTPIYLIYSWVVPQRLLCVNPRVKMIAMLRDPTDRMYSQYHFSLIYLEDQMHKMFPNGVPSFDDLVDQEIEKWYTWFPPNVSLSSAEEARRWQLYLSNKNHTTFVARGMYVIQLYHWITFLRDTLGDTWKDQLEIADSKGMSHDRNRFFENIQRFVGMPLYSLPEEVKAVANKGSYPAMNATTRVKLNKLYAPYNKRLDRLLTSQGFSKMSWITKDE